MKKENIIIVAVMAIVTIVVLASFLITHEEERKPEWSGIFEGDYVFLCGQGTELPAGDLFMVLEDGMCYKIEYMYGSAWENLNGTYKNTCKPEVNALLKYIEFWQNNYSVINAEKGYIKNQTELDKLFNNQTQIESFMRLNESYSYRPLLLDGGDTIIGIKNKEQRHRVSIYAYEEDGRLPTFDWYHQQLTTLRSLR